MCDDSLIKKRRKVMIPGVGAMDRVRTLTRDGEEIAIEYRWPRGGDEAGVANSSRPGPKSPRFAVRIP